MDTESTRRAGALGSAAVRLALWMNGTIELEERELRSCISQLELLCAVANEVAKHRR